MPNMLEAVKDVIEQFQKVQRHMLIAKKENAAETYESLKEDYLSLKAILNPFKNKEVTGMPGLSDIVKDSVVEFSRL